jgi:G3E family GTPase
MEGRGTRRPVTVVTGFLGSGKTTLLGKVLSEPSMANTAVLVNEFGEIGLDHHLLRRVDERTVLLGSGCVCCTTRKDLVGALLELLALDERGEIPRLDRVVIETTGLADPAPILYTIFTDPVLHLLSRLGKINPSAPILKAAFGDVDVDEIFRPGGPEAHAAPESVLAEPHQLHDVGDTYSVSVTFEGAIDWTAFGIWFSMLLHARGEDVLRVKGLLDVGEVGPVVINGVQHIIHPPRHLDGWPDEDRRSRIIFITKRISPEEILDSLEAFRELLGARPVPLGSEHSVSLP